MVRILLTMKHLLEEQPSPGHISSSESTVTLSRDDQEMGSSAIPITNGDTTIKNPIFCWFLRTMDPNPARMVFLCPHLLFSTYNCYIKFEMSTW